MAEFVESVSLSWQFRQIFKNLDRDRRRQSYIMAWQSFDDFELNKVFDKDDLEPVNAKLWRYFCLERNELRTRIESLDGFLSFEVACRVGFVTEENIKTFPVKYCLGDIKIPESVRLDYESNPQRWIEGFINHRMERNGLPWIDFLAYGPSDREKGIIPSSYVKDMRSGDDPEKEFGYTLKRGLRLPYSPNGYLTPIFKHRKDRKPDNFVIFTEEMLSSAFKITKRMLAQLSEMVADNNTVFTSIKDPTTYHDHITGLTPYGRRVLDVYNSRRRLEYVWSPLGIDVRSPPMETYLLTMIGIYQPNSELFSWLLDEIKMKELPRKTKNTSSLGWHTRGFLPMPPGNDSTSENSEGGEESYTSEENSGDPESSE